jgi:cobalt-zinc-cadmium efflux system outer membrane protein
MNPVLEVRITSPRLDMRQIDLPATTATSRSQLLCRSRSLLSTAVFLVGTGASAQVANTLSLHEAVTEALQSPRAKIADEQPALAQAQVKQAALGLNPRLYLQSEDLHPWDNNFSFPNDTEDYAYLSQTFEVDGKRSKRVALADANARRAAVDRDYQKRQIAAQVAAAYWTAVADRKIAGLLDQDMGAVDSMVKYHQERVDAGAMRGVDLIRMKIERDRIDVSLQGARRDAELAETELYRQIGRPTLKGVTLTDDISSTDVLPAVDLEAALSQRLEIDAAKSALTAAEADVRLQRANGVPDPELFAGYKRDVGVNTAYAALQIPLPLRNRNQGEIARAEAQVRIARASLEQTQLAVRADIEAAEENYRRELEIVRDTLPEMRAEAKQNLQIETEAYRLGGVDLLRYLDAERTELDVEVMAIRTLGEFHQAAVRLQLATGVQP